MDNKNQNPKTIWAITPKFVMVAILVFGLFFVIGTIAKGRPQETLYYDGTWPPPHTDHQADELAGGPN
jgi:hypothetical protein